MGPRSDPVNNLPESPISLVKAIRNNVIPAKALTREPRQTCVEYLGSEGYSTGEIAEILKVHPRTIRRDREDIRERNAVSIDPDFIARHVGQLLQRAQHAISSLTRISREKDCPYAVKVKAIKETWRISKELTEALQSVGYLPNIPKELGVELRHGLCEPPGRDEITRELDMLRASTEEAGITDEQITQTIRALEGLVARSSASRIIKHIQSKTKQEDEDD